MSRLTLRVPDTLHAALAKRARSEGVSMNQYLVFALSRIATAEDVAAQRAKFDLLLGRYPREESEAALAKVLKKRK